MRLLKTHSHTSERPGYEARKNAKKIIEGNADTIRANHPSKPAAFRHCTGGGETTRRYGKTNHRQHPPAYRRRGGGGRDEERRIKVQHRREDKGNQSQTPPTGYHHDGGGETNDGNQHEMERWHNPQSREGGRCLAENAIKRENKTTCITK